MTIAASLAIAAVSAILAAGAPTEADRAVERGHGLVEGRCSSCHAIETTGASPNPAAPPFRSLGSRYPLPNLEEAFAEGAYVGHAEMPNFVLEPNEISDLMAYLKRLNDPPKK